MDWLAIAKDWGWVGVLILFSIKEVWPLVSKQFIRERGAALKTMQEEKRISQEERQADIKRADADRVWQREMQSRSVDAIEMLARIMPEIRDKLDTVQRQTEDIRGDTKVLVDRKATVVTTTIPTP